MKITIHQKSALVPEPLKSRIEKKIDKLERFFGDDIEAIVKLSEERGGRNIAEITINLDGAVLRAEEVSNDMYMSFDRSIDKIVRQTRKHRARFEKRLRAGAFDIVPEDEPAAPELSAEEVAGRLVRVKRFELEPMTAEEAIEQMDMLGHSFFMFLNADTGGICVVYQRRDEDIGMLEPINL
jgi:putative sigma-54 modulation protein